MTPLASITATAADAVARETPSSRAMSPRDRGLIASRSRIRALIRKPQPSAAHYRNSSKFLEGETGAGCSDFSRGVWCEHPGNRLREQDIFARKDLPLFRVQAIVRREGLDADGRASMIQVRSSQTLLEGADSAMLSRSQSAAHGGSSGDRSRISLFARVGNFLLGQSLAWTYIVAANLLAPNDKP